MGGYSQFLKGSWGGTPSITPKSKICVNIVKNFPRFARIYYKFSALRADIV